MENKSQQVKKPNFFKGINRVAKAMGIEKVSMSQAVTAPDSGLVTVDTQQTNREVTPPTLTPQSVVDRDSSPSVPDAVSKGDTATAFQNAEAQDNTGITVGTGESDETQSLTPVTSPPETPPSVVPLVPRSEVVPIATDSKHEEEIKPELRTSPDISMPSVSKDPIQTEEDSSVRLDSLGGALEALVLESDLDSYINPDGSIDSSKVNSAALKYVQDPKNIDMIESVDPVLGTFLRSIADRGLLQNGSLVASGLKVISGRKDTKKAA